MVREQAQPILDQATADTLAGREGPEAQSRITRGFDGAVTTGLRLKFVNAAAIKAQGWDLTVRHERRVTRDRVGSRPGLDLGYGVALGRAETLWAKIEDATDRDPPLAQFALDMIRAPQIPAVA